MLEPLPDHIDSLVQSIEARSELGDDHEARTALCQDLTGMLTIPLPVPAFSAKTGGSSGSYLGRSVGTISALAVAERSSRDATGAENRTL